MVRAGAAVGKNVCWVVVLGLAVLASSVAADRERRTARAAEAAEGSDAKGSGAQTETARGAAASAEHFESVIAPLLARHCLECHDAGSKKGQLDLSRKDAAFAGGEIGDAIVPGKPDESLLWELVESDAMPENRPSLSDEEKRSLREWIEAGATWSVDRIDPSLYVEDARPAENWLRRLTVPEYIATVRAAVGVDIEREARQILPPDFRADGFSNTAYNLNIDLGHVEAYAELAELIVRRMDVERFAADFASCRELSDDCMGELIAGMGKWVLRGPLEEHEVEAFRRVANAVAEEGGDFDEAAAYVLEAMLQSPRFVYRIEHQRGDDGAPVGQYELASRLSYILWGAPPDKELMRAADAGELADRSAVEMQVQRMLADPRAVDRSAQFMHEWLNLGQLDNLRPNRERFPKWSAAIAADMRAETLAFFREVAWEQKRPLWDLMNAQVSFVTPRLAEHYGLDPDEGVAAPDVGPLAQGRQAAHLPRRITRGLQALYTFDEGRGTTVHDSSGAGEALDLNIEDAGAVRWSHGGLTVTGSTRIATTSSPKRLVDALEDSDAVTVEAWVTPDNASQDGPARIVTLSNNISQRNFTLGQAGDRFDMRLRTIATSGNGQPSLSSSPGTVDTRQTHVVYTRDASGAAVIYIDGRPAGERRVEGNFSNWSRDFRLAVANELSKDRPWKGTLHTVAIYDRALSADEVRQNEAAGPRGESARALTNAATGGGRVDDDLEALYTFDEGSGETVRDRSGNDERLDLRIEDAGAVAWSDDGLTVNGATRITTAEPARRLSRALKRSKALTLEAWVTPADTEQNGPARIATLSSNTTNRDFTLGQEADKYDVRLRTTETNGNGMPGLSTPSGAATTRPTHVVYTRDASGQARLYVDGEETSSKKVGGDFGNWDEGFRFAVANELSKDRPWRGTLHTVAVYSRALAADDVRRNHAAGSRRTENAAAIARSAPWDGRVERDDLQALYRFGEGNGKAVRDTSGAGDPLDLVIEDPSATRWGHDGLTVSLSTRIATQEPPKRLIEAIRKSKAATIEAWITPADTSQDGPARIVTLSSGTSRRNFTLGQDGDKYDVRFRASKTDANGMPGLAGPSGSAERRATHVVYTRDASGKARLYIDGEQVSAREVEGDLSNWDQGFELALANETTRDRPWRGTLHRVAIYSRALSAEAVRAMSQPEPGTLRFDLASIPSRGGLLTQGSVLTIGGDEASMVTRGLFVLKDLLYSRVGDPPPCLDTTPVPTKPGLSQREIAQQRIADASCGGCHSKFEPLAFGLEKYDGLGTYHDVDEHGNELRDDGEIVFPGEDEAVAYDSAAEFMDLLAESPRVRKNITRKVIQFALGRPLGEADRGAIDEIHRAAQEGGGTYASLITAVVMSDLVRTTPTEKSR